MGTIRGVNPHTSREVGEDPGSDALRDLLPRRVGSYLQLESEDIEALRQLQQRRMSLKRDQQIIGEGDEFTRAYVMLDGWAARYMTLPDGRRQIVNFILPGDFFCLNAVLFRRSRYAISTVTAAIACPFDADQFRAIALRRPLLSMAIAWCNAREEAMLAEHVTSIGRRNSHERIAHLIMELWRRLEIIGMVDGEEFEMPLRQAEIADCLGLSTVHVSRTLQSLRQEGLIEIDTRSRRIRVVDRERLKRTAGFEGEYLYFTEVPRTQSG